MPSWGDMSRKAGKPPIPLDAYVHKCAMRNPCCDMFCCTDIICSMHNMSWYLIKKLHQCHKGKFGWPLAVVKGRFVSSKLDPHE